MLQLMAQTSTFVIPKNGDLVTDLTWTGDEIKNVYIMYKDEKIWEGTKFSHTLNLLPCGYHNIRVVVSGKNFKLQCKFICFEDIELRRFLSTRDVLLKNNQALIETGGIHIF